MKKIHEWEFWDWKSIIFGVLIIGGLFCLIFYFEKLPIYFRSSRSKTYSNKTEGDFIKWHRRTYLSQSRTGSHIITSGFEITYSYVVNKTKYIETDFVPSVVSYQKFLGQLEYSGISKFLIEYDPKSPANSQIEIDTTNK